MDRAQHMNAMDSLLAAAITLRPAMIDDRDFAWSVYADGIRPYMAAYMAWDDTDQAARFARIYDHRHSAIVLHDDRPAGWLTVVGHDSTILLQQFFIAGAYRGHGIGSHLLAGLCAEWDGMDRPVSLAVLKNNPAQRLYLRFGFRTYWQNADRHFMLRPPGNPAA